MNILVLGTSPIIRQGIISILSMDCDQNKYYEVSTVNDALERVKEVFIDIAFVDLHLGMDKASEFIKKTKETYDYIKYVIITFSENQYDLVVAEQLEVDGYIVRNALVEDILYAMKVMSRNQKFIPPMLVDTIERAKREGYGSLTDRELEVFRLLKSGKTNAQISKELYISEATTKKHVSNILTKLNLSHRVDVVLYANRA